MYWSDGANVDALPRCTDHIKHKLNPTALKKNAKVYDAFIKACGGQRKEAEKALTWGNSPSVGVSSGLLEIGGRTMCAVNPPTFFNQNNKGFIISSLRTTPFEKCLADADLVNNRRRFECTVLHETVHIVRMITGLPDLDWDFPDIEEPGDQFEIWAYGRRTCTADDLADAAASYM